jgi:hypothetical protein
LEPPACQSLAWPGRRQLYCPRRQRAL